MMPKCIPKCLQGWIRLLYSALVVASVLHWIGASMAFLETPTLILLQSFTAGGWFDRPSDKAPSPSAFARTAVVKITDDEYLTRYRATTPLNRCVLKDDLSRLLNNKELRTISIDFSLAPPYRLSLPHADADEQRCQDEIEELIVSHGKRLVLIYPFEYEADVFEGAAFVPSRGDPREPVVGVGSGDAVSQRRIRVIGWVDKMRAKASETGISLSFGSSALSVDQGVVVRIPQPELTSFVEQMQRRRHEADARVAGTPTAPSMPKLDDPPPPIAYASLGAFRYGDDGRGLRVNDPCVTGQEACSSAPIEHVIFGGGYGRDDRYLTPVGELHGVDIHAAALATRPPWNPWFIAFVFSTVLGLLLGWLLKCLWRFYFAWVGDHASPSRSGSRPEPLDAAPLLIASIGVLAVAICAIVVSAVLLRRGYWTSPFGTILGMAVDALILVPIEQSRETIAKLAGSSSAAAGQNTGATKTKAKSFGIRRCSRQLRYWLRRRNPWWPRLRWWLRRVSWFLLHLVIAFLKWFGAALIGATLFAVFFG